MQLGEIFNLQGSIEQAIYYLRQGLELSKKISSPILIAQFATAIGNIDVNKELAFNCRECLDIAGISLQKHADFVISCSNRHFLKGNIARAEQLNRKVDILDEFLEAVRLIDVGIDPRYLEDFDKIQFSEIILDPAIKKSVAKKKEEEKLTRLMILKCSTLESQKAEISCSAGIFHNNISGVFS